MLLGNPSPIEKPATILLEVFDFLIGHCVESPSICVENTIPYGQFNRNSKENKGISEMVGDPGIEPGMSLLGGVTVRCRTLQHVAQQGGG